MQYQTLEGNSLSSLGVTSPTFNGTDVSFYTTSSFVYTLLFIAIVGAAFYRYILVGVYRMEASESGIRKSNETFKRTTLGLLGVFGLFLVIFTINKGLLTGDVDLREFNTGGYTGSAGTGAGTIGNTNTGSGASSASCESPANTISKLQSSGGICGGVTCSALSGCNYQTYLPIIERETGGDVQLKKMIIVTMCKESKAKPQAKNQNQNGTYDCGLMQINQPGACDPNPSSTQIEDNIRRGVALMRQKIGATSQIYQNIPAETGAFSSYNCCANGTVPNSPSSDCTVSTGFPYAIPKWACPINPGGSGSNMCTVKSYACELSACLNQL